MALKKNHNFDRVALVLQGGGSLGAYHIGAYKALEEAGYVPDVICGISIGAITSCILAGNEPGERVAKLEEFWHDVSWPSLVENIPMSTPVRRFHNQMSSLQAVLFGQPNFFAPWFPPTQMQPKGSGGATSHYDTSKLRDTLLRLSDFDRFNSGKTRLITGAAKVSTGELVFFDSGTMKMEPEHVMASGSLPPGFPGMRIDGELYWDGGAVSNTPLEGIFKIKPALNTLVFMVDLFNPECQDPQNLDDVEWVGKNLLYASRTGHNINQHAEKHNLRKALNHVLQHLPDNLKNDGLIQEIKDYASDVNYHFVHIVYKAPETEIKSSDYEFSRPSIRDRSSHGYEDMSSAIQQADWLKEHPKHIGSKVHRYVNKERK